MDKHPDPIHAMTKLSQNRNQRNPKRKQILKSIDRDYVPDGIPSQTCENLGVDDKAKQRPLDVDRLLADEATYRASKMLALATKLKSGCPASAERQMLLRMINGDVADTSIVLQLEACVKRARASGNSFAHVNAVHVARLSASLGLVLPYRRYVDVLRRKSTRKPVCELVIDGTRNTTTLLSLLGGRNEIVHRLVDKVGAHVKRH